MLPRNSMHLRARGHAPAPSRLRAEHPLGPISCSLHASRTTRGKEVEMKRIALLITFVLACSRTPLGLHAPDGGSPGVAGSGGSVVVTPASGGSSGTGGAVGGSGTFGGAGGVGGAPATGGMISNGGAISASGGSVFTGDLDSCSSDADCTTSCTWTTAPTDSSQCSAYYCCGSNWMSKRRCEANQAAWAIYCPNQSSTFIECPCAVMCDAGAQTFTFGCVGGKCEVVCSPPLGGAGGSTVFPPASGGSSGSGGGGGMGGAITGSGGIVGTDGAIGSDGTPGSGGMGGTGGTAGSSSVYGMPCTTNQDCPSDAICCDGSNESCDGTRLPSGDGTNASEFVVSADGLTVTDTITGLVWQRDGSGTRAGCSGGVDGGTDGLTCSWAEAQGYCAALVLGGVSGWRLPARMELLTIMDCTVTNPSIDLAAFPNTPAYSLWTSSPYASSPGYAWCVDFSYGEGSVYNGVGYGNGVRCVRGSRCYPTTRFMVQSDGLVLDTLTQLTWQQQASSTTMDWADAQTHCSSAGFRLPTVKELGSLVDLAIAVGATINQTAFPATSAEWFWTSSPYAGSSGYFAWGVNFGNGVSNGHNVSGNDWVRCVR